jgi:hypothetical protein
LRTSPQH